MIKGIASCVFVGSLILSYTKKYFNGGVNYCKRHLKENIIVITGSNTGIGKETVYELSKTGANIILACRDEKKTMQTIKEI